MRWLGVINLTWENLQIAKHKSGIRSFSSADWSVLCDLQIFSGKVYHPEPPHAQYLFLFPIVFGVNYRKRGSVSYIVREVHSVRERERERERERDRERERQREREREIQWDGSDVTIVGLKLAMNLHVPLVKNSRWLYTFPCQKLALFVSPFTLHVSPFTERSPLWRWNSQWVHTFRCQKHFRPLCSHSFKWRVPRDEWSKTQDKRSNPAQSYIVLPIEKMNQN